MNPLSMINAAVVWKTNRSGFGCASMGFSVFWTTGTLFDDAMPISIHARIWNERLEN